LTGGTGNDRSCVSEHRLRGRRGRTGLHRRHRASTCPACWCVHQHRRAAVRARPSWSGHSSPLSCWLRRYSSDTRLAMK
jgi:hypothetical protein